MDLLLRSGRPVVLRIPVIGGYTDTDINQQLMCEFLSIIMRSVVNVLKIQLIKEHNLGITKYESLQAADSSFPMAKYTGVTDEAMLDYKKRLKKVVHIPVEICRV